MHSYFWVVGTDTDVGKTFVTTSIMKLLQSKNKSVIPYKPIQTGVTDPQTSDYGFYQLHSKYALNEQHINSYSLKVPASPHYAAQLENITIDEQYILKQIEQLKNLYDVVICEGAGGLFVPIDEKRNIHFIDVIEQSKLPVLLVAKTSLGTINHTMLSLEVLKMRNIDVLAIVLNAHEGTELEKDNIETIKTLTNIPTIVLPKVEVFEDLKIENLEFFERVIPIE